ncbi:MAG: BglG family transcription antiterminator [Anaerorhabdus sp.]
MKIKLEYEHKLIIEYLYKTDENFVSSSVLCAIVSMSNTSTTKLINDLALILKNYGATIESKSGRGYKLVVSDAMKFNHFLETSFWFERMWLSDTVDMLHYIIRTFLSNDYVRSTHFEENLHIARRSVFNLYRLVNEEVEKFKLKLASAASKGNSVEGSEHNIRCCINYELTYLQNSNINEDEKFSSIYQNLSQMKLIEQSIIGYQKKKNISLLDDSSIKGLSSALYIAHSRNNMGYMVEYDEDVVDRFTNRNSYYFACDLVGELIKKYKLNLTDSEQLFTTIYIVAHRSFMKEDDFPITENYYDCLEVANELVEHLHNVNHFKFLNGDKKLVEVLSLNMTQILTQVEFSLYRASTNAYGKNALQAILMAVQCASYIEKKYEFKLSEWQINYLSILIYPVFGRYPFTNIAKKAIVISHINKSAACGIAERIKRNYGTLLSDLKIVNLYELDSLDLSEYSFIFTSYDHFKLPKLPKYIKVIEVNTFFSSSEKLIIRKDLIEASFMMMGNYHKLLDEIVVRKEVDVKCREEFYEFISKGENECFLNEFYNYEKYMNYPVYNNVAFITPLVSRSDKALIRIYIFKKNINWYDSKIKIVVYWDRGNSSAYSNYFENESIPSMLFQIFTQKKIIELLMKEDTQQLKDLIYRLGNQVNENIIGMGASFR